MKSQQYLCRRPNRFSFRSVKLLLLSMVLASQVSAQQPIALIEADKPSGGWKFNNGAEFPGARGELQVVDEMLRGSPVLALRGDFTGGGNYVDAQIALPEVAVDVVSFWVNAPSGANAVPIRLIDGTDQCHQLKIKINNKGGWQKITIPVDDFFRKIGTSSALDITTQYEKWGGANDGRWHQPGKLFVVLCTRDLGTKVEVRIADVKLQPSKPTTIIKKTIPLDTMVQQGELDWQFNLGREFPGAKGALEITDEAPQTTNGAMRLHADFTGGGAYVGMRKSFAPLAVSSMTLIRMKLRSKTTKQFALRLVDGTGQCHQQKTIPVTADGKWHEITIDPIKIAGGEHWGGANDGKWHDTVQMIELMLNERSSDAKVSDLYIADIRADVTVQATSGSASIRTEFDSAESLSDNWQTEGDVAIREKSLRLSRTLKTLQVETRATGKPFAVSPGAWLIEYSWSSDLHSPDNSYHGSVSLEVLDRSGGTIEMLPVEIGFGKHDSPRPVAKTLEIADGAAQARFCVELNKTYGSFSIHSLSASRLKLQPIEEKVDRVLLATDSIGNLFLPGDELTFHVTVESKQPLLDAERMLRYRVRDYRDTNILSPSEVELSKQSRRNGRFAYSADIVLPKGKIAVGKYHELHVVVPLGWDNEYAEYSGFARLPIASTKQHRPEEIPFTIRNWDSRIPVYFRLADRLGLRMLGVWGGWSSQSPYKPHCPGIELCQSLDAKWITGTPAADVERNGFNEYSEAALRVGMVNFLKAYADKGLAMIAMGNEPHGTGDKVLENVRAYKAIYESVKSFDPSIHVMGTSVEPNDEYFKAGYHKYLDSYDFHIYEHYTHVRTTMRQYRDLMMKYDAVKPIHSTELGLNSQGQTRLAVSREMIKKVVSFFAEGGDTVSWFTIQYPDPNGKARGQFGDSHCMFDCKYNLYNPRLDAITHYHLVNAIGAKKFVSENRYGSGSQSYLFRDKANHCLQVLWCDEEQEDIVLPFASGQRVRMIEIDGTQRELIGSKSGLKVMLSDDPILLLFDEAQAAHE